MKNIILFLSFVLFTFSCSKNDESPITFQEQLIGEWQINSFVINSCPDASENVALTMSDDNGCIDINGDTACMSIFIFENGLAEIHNSDSFSSEDVEKMTYELDEINHTITLCQESQDCATFSMQEGGLYNEMDEEGCICTFGFKKTSV